MPFRDVGLITDGTHFAGSTDFAAPNSTGRLMQKILRFLADEDGPTAVEYAIMLALIIIVCLAAIQAVGVQASSSFTDSQSKINTAFSQAGVGN